MALLIGRAAERRAGPGLALAGGADRIARAARDMAGRFVAGGKLLAFGDGVAAADAGHLAVEFTHPVIVGKRALPAMSLDPGTDRMGGYAAQVRLLGRPGDVAVGISTDDRPGATALGLTAARELDLLTIALTVRGPDGGLETGGLSGVDHVLATGGDPLVAREIHVTIYHILWELVHVFIESETC
jgi:D-sedoheptulose 7-phosphate isomerase